VAVATKKGVVVGEAIDRVIVVRADDKIPGLGGLEIDRRVADELIVTDDVETLGQGLICYQGVVSVDVLKRVIGIRLNEEIVTDAANHRIGAGAAIERILAGAANQLVIAIIAAQITARTVLKNVISSE